uniref:Uncharacterized protein n=1 Tax=Anguilla anguilla TaxID=7936 RepID=A0A0E9R8V7_ANGAN
MISLCSTVQGVLDIRTNNKPVRLSLYKSHKLIIAMQSAVSYNNTSSC